MSLLVLQLALLCFSIDNKFVLLKDFNQFKEVLGNVQIFVDHVIDLLLDNCVELCHMHGFLLTSKHELECFDGCFRLPRQLLLVDYFLTIFIIHLFKGVLLLQHQILYSELTLRAVNRGHSHVWRFFLVVRHFDCDCAVSIRLNSDIEDLILRVTEHVR